MGGRIADPNGGRLGAALVGVSAAFQAPRWVRGRRFEQLLENDDGDHAAARLAAGPAAAAGSTTAAGSTIVAGSITAAGSSSSVLAATAFGVRVARALLRRLAWLPFSPWRNTCLYRSIAECLVLRRYGVPAAIRLGVRRQDSGEVGRAPSGSGPSVAGASIVAHAWVVHPGGAEVTTHVPLVPSAQRSP